MALLKFTDGKTANVNAATGRRIWDIMNGNAEPADDKELRVCDRVANVYLDWRTAPDDYIRAHFDNIASAVVGHWMVAAVPADAHGQRRVDVAMATLPDPTDSANIAFSIKWGLLIKNGRATTLARRYM